MSAQTSTYLRELYVYLSTILQCPLLSQGNMSRKFHIQEQENDDSIELFESEETKELFEKLRLFILPSQERIALLEWLLEQYEPGIMDSQEFNLLKNKSETQKIKAVLIQLGIQNYPRSAFNSLSASIEGLNGTQDSIQLLHRVAKFVANSQQMGNIDSKNFEQLTDKLLSHICQNQSAIFQTSVRLFPPGFSKTEDHSEQSLDQLDSLIEDLTSKVESIRTKLKDLNASTLQENYDKVVYASKSDLEELAEAVGDFKSNMSRFNEEFEGSFKKRLSRLAQNNMQSQLGSKVEDTIKHMQHLKQSSDDFQGLVENIGKLNVKLQMIGLNEGNNYTQDFTIDNDKVLEIVKQIKELKVSFAFQERKIKQ